MKYLVNGGCSFTANKESWGNLTLPNHETINVGISGVGNHVISTRVIEQVLELIQKGVSTKDIKVIVQWSGLFRLDLVVDRNLNVPRQISSLPAPIQVDEKDCPTTWVTDAGRTGFKIWPSVYGVISDEQFFIQTLENILRTEWFLKSNNIEYRMFTGWDIFTSSEKINRGHLSKNRKTEVTVNQSQFVRAGKYKNIDNKLFSDIYLWSKPMWDMIDFDKWWFYEDNKIKYGGLQQWVFQNINYKNWYLSDRDNHPSKLAHQEFFENVIKEIF